MVLWLESSMDPVDPSLLKTFREEPKGLHLEVASNPLPYDPDQAERMVNLAALRTTWMKWFRHSSLDSIAQRRLGLPKNSHIPHLHITACHCPDPTTNLARHSSPCHFSQRAYYAACLRTAEMVVLELPFLDLGDAFEGRPLTELKLRIKALLDCTRSRRYPFDPVLLSVYRTLFEFVELDCGIGFVSDSLQRGGKEWLKWLETHPDSDATSAEVPKKADRRRLRPPAH
ncbi:hypothetical protein V5O48_017605 [Marasmius crinis-equi]|uniref:Uncharacterized protein n=1 Tax=Marasmius crinis-equi TaxID=585013 RepID=A0ABR3ENI8_9AGAR